MSEIIFTNCDLTPSIQLILFSFSYTGWTPRAELGFITWYRSSFICWTHQGLSSRHPLWGNCSLWLWRRWGPRCCAHRDVRVFLCEWVVLCVRVSVYVRCVSIFEVCEHLWGVWASLRCVNIFEVCEHLWGVWASGSFQVKSTQLLTPILQYFVGLLYSLTYCKYAKYLTPKLNRLWTTRCEKNWPQMSTMLNISMCVAETAQIFVPHVATMKDYIFIKWVWFHVWTCALLQTYYIEYPLMIWSHKRDTLYTIVHLKCSFLNTSVKI